MAFGFLKKIVAAITGGASKPKRQQPGGGKKRRRGGKGRSKQQPSGGGQQQPQASGGNSAGAQRKKEGQQQRGQQQGQRRQRGDRQGGGERSQHGGRRGEQGRRRPPAVDTAAGEMRPGGDISAEELASRREAHSKWSLDSFVVEPCEGKKRFHDFDLPSEVMHGIADLGFKYCTEIQALSLEQALAGKNIAGKAQTGSGKTAAFLVAILTRYLRSPGDRAKRGGAPRALVIAPTRELVIQICQDADAIGKYTGLRSIAIYGGMDYDRQRREIMSSPVDLLVATPGRLLDFTKSHVLDLSKVDTLVIDEADRMLDMG